MYAHAFSQHGSWNCANADCCNALTLSSSPASSRTLIYFALIVVAGAAQSCGAVDFDRGHRPKD